MPSAPKRSEGSFWRDGARPHGLRHAEHLAATLAEIAAVSGLLVFFLSLSMELEAGSQLERSGAQTAIPPIATKATASTAATKPEVVSALTLPRPAHDITVSKDGRIFMMM